MSNWDTRLREWQNLDVPEGWRAEITSAGVRLTPPVDNGHSRIAASVHRAFARAVPEDRVILQTLGIAIRGASRLYLPDLVVVPERELSRPDNVPVPAEAAELVVEIVSQGNARTDRVEKLWAYAQAPVPLYLLIDRYAEPKPSVTLFSDPVDGHYRRSEQVSFGEEIRLPAPFDLVLATAAF
ncbi:Uma2 family endonuclease [Amycolatopsis thermalba]|uniref:Uma2 family endonuclease n=1 Tax=Amycolatopsis thermalba TaxID=944492 RepID=A0ABY4P5R6_9PSEU|nr:MULTISPECIES: Uma2 family endonuclease [Amycolatopsis]UQS27503.1 Uma2 family endonuclease [Amycolatopsis thermalba]